MGKRLKNTLIYVCIRLLFGLLRSLGFGGARRFGRWLGRRAWRLAGQERRRALTHLSWAFPDLDERQRVALGRDSFGHLGQGVAEVVCAHRIRDWPAFIDFEPGAREVLDHALAEARGVVFVTGHVGNWELMARGLTRLAYPIHTIGQKSYDPRLTRLLADFREQGSVHTLWRGEPDIIERMLKVIDDKEIMGLLIDQDTKVPSVFVPFFGRQAATPTAPAMLARKTGAALICGFNHRRADGGLRLSIQRIDLSESPDPKAAIVEDTRAMSAAIEAHIRAHPGEWIWMHRRWKSRPPAEP